MCDITCPVCLMSCLCFGFAILLVLVMSWASAVTWNWEESFRSGSWRLISVMFVVVKFYCVFLGFCSGAKIDALMKCVGIWGS